MRPTTDAKDPKISLALLVMLLMASFLFTATALAVGAEQTDPTNPGGPGAIQGSVTPMATPSTGDEAPKTLPDFSALKTQAEERGSVSIIVGLDVLWQPSGKMPAALAQAQEANIFQAQDQLLDSLTPGSFEVLSRYTFIPAMALRVDGTALEQLDQAPEVTTIRENTSTEPTLNESIPLIGANRAWAAGFTGAGQTVAILDTGVDRNHPFLVGRVVSEACYSTTDATTRATSVCPNGANTQTGPGAGSNCATNISGCTHGTHVAGIAAGEVNDTAGQRIMAGVAPDADIIAIQVFRRIDNAPNCGAPGQPACACGPNPSPCARSSSNDQLSALQRVFALRSDFAIAAVNLSLGDNQEHAGNCDAILPAYQQAITALNSAGIAVVIASGNESYSNGINWPACNSSAISVGSTTDDKFGDVEADTVSSFTNIAATLDLFAPGEWIYSSVPGDWGTKGGTSMAAPHVAGAFAVLRQRGPNATIDDIWTALECTGHSILDDRSGLTRSRIQVNEALLAVRLGVINVDRAFSGSENGSRARPFNTVAEGINAIGSYGYVTIRSGTYNEPMTINRARTLCATQGIVTIGR